VRRIFILSACLFCLLASSAFAAEDGKIFEIREKMFVGQTNDIYLNPDEYLGRTIKLEGMFGIIDDIEGGAPCYFVYRYGPGCCGYDSNVGFEVEWSGVYPAQDEWVEATGVLVSYDYEGIPYLKLSLSSLEVKSERGLESVTQ
jgi:uncharacterized membrane protein YcgQ (UPF0703/DUF1980 family)